jgi:polysaccharide deacetylase family protein (PEP-CTERM system associated)
MINAFTVDLEDWFCSHNLQHAVNYKSWDQQESRVERNTFKLLELLNSRKVIATFFVLGWIAERFPGLVKVIQEEGHEIASHGYAHQLVTAMGKEEFKTDILRSINVLEEICGKKPDGYRAPAFSITRKNKWAFEVLQQAGFRYDSSVYPFTMHPDYGFRNASLAMHYPVKQLLEVPLSCSNYAGIRIPCSGGAYLRFYPYSLFSHLSRNILNKNRPLIFYIHPWEVDDAPPKVLLPFFKSLRHYYNSSSSVKKIERLLSEFEFTSIQNVINEQQRDAAIPLN